MEPRKQAIIDALANFIRQRPGLEFANYGDVSSYRSEARRIAADKRHAMKLLVAVAGNDGITADMLVAASDSAFSGRLTICEGPGPDRNYIRRNGDVRIDYTTGQYFPTEYRKAVAAVCASALWYYVREHVRSKSDDDVRYAGNDPANLQWRAGRRWLSPGDWLRAYFRRQFGRTIAARYFQ